MSQILVGVTAVAVPSKGRQRPVIQNLGPGNIYFSDRQIDCTVGTGLKLIVGGTFEFASPIGSDDDQLWVIADAAGTALRFLSLGG